MNHQPFQSVRKQQTTMKIIESPLTVPPAILGLADVTASEKLLLALYAAEPDARNYRALKVLGMGESGLKKIKRRLLAKGLLLSKATGYQVVVPGRAPVPEGGGHFFPKLTTPKKRKKWPPQRSHFGGWPAPMKSWTITFPLGSLHSAKGRT